MPSISDGIKKYSEANLQLDMQLKKDKFDPRIDLHTSSKSGLHFKKHQNTEMTCIITLCVWGAHFMYMYMHLLFESFQFPKKVFYTTNIHSQSQWHKSLSKRIVTYENDITASGLKNGSSTDFVLILLSGFNKIKINGDFLRRYPLKEHVYFPLLTILQELKLYNFQCIKVKVYIENMDWRTCDCIAVVNAWPALKKNWDKPTNQKETDQLAELTKYTHKPQNRTDTEDITRNNRDNKIRKYGLSFVVAFFTLLILRCFFPGEVAMNSDGFTSMETNSSSSYFNQTVCFTSENGHLQRCSIESNTSGKGICNFLGTDVRETGSQEKNVPEPSCYVFDRNFTEQNINKDRCTPEEVVCGKDEMESKHLKPPQTNVIVLNKTNVIVLNNKELRRNSSLHDIGKDRYIFEEVVCGKDEMESRYLTPPLTNLVELGNIELNKNSPAQNTGKGILNGCNNNRIRRVSFVPLCKGCMNGVFPTVSRKISISRIDFGCSTCQWFAKQLLDMVQILILFLFISRGFFLKGSKQRMKIGFCHIILICVVCLLGIVHTERTNCSASISTMTVVNKCPRTEIEWKEREKAKRCQAVTQECTNKTKFKYHCLQNEWGNATVEVCAEVWFINCHCVEYNTGAGIVQESVDRPFPIIKRCRYKSNIPENKHCRMVNKTALPPYTSIRGHNQTKGIFFVETNMQQNREKTIKIEEDGSAYNRNVAIVSLTVIVGLVVCILLPIYIYKQRQNQRQDNQHEEKKEEEEDML